MKGLLVRVGIDQTYGGWNAPVDPESGEFTYVPIPEGSKVRFHRGMRRPFKDIQPALGAFRNRSPQVLDGVLTLPSNLLRHNMHLDPDFEYLTYGNRGNARGSRFASLARDDVVAFYAGLRPTAACAHKLLYALIGLYVVDEVVSVTRIGKRRWDENAHTRKVRHDPGDVVIRARASVSGRLSRCIPIGEWRSGAYRVRKDLLKRWGGLSVTDGFIQRSAIPPRFLDARRFYDWFLDQDVPLVPFNNPTASRKIVIVHLRQPRRHDPNETRADPFWEFGSFGCTGCHHRNLMNPSRIHELEGARLAFAQGGPDGFKLVLLTPPVQAVKHRDRCELQWTRTSPFTYSAAPLLVDNDGQTDFPSLLKSIATVNRETLMACFSSRFRSSRTPLPDQIAVEIERTFDQRVTNAPARCFAKSYDQALPFPPPKVDRNRKRTYRELIAKASGRKTASHRCRTATKRKGKKSRRKTGCR